MTIVAQLASPVARSGSARPYALAGGAAAVLSIALVATLTGSSGTPQRETPIQRAAGAAHPAPTPAPAARRYIEELAGVVASRYRVSGEATRGFVEAALREARRHELDPLLVLALIAVESRFNPVAQSQYGAIGLMQIIPRFHRDKMGGAHDRTLLDPHANIQLGTRVLKEYIRRGGTEAAGLQLYNGAADDATRAYAQRVMTERERLRQAMRRARDDRA